MSVFRIVILLVVYVPAARYPRRQLHHEWRQLAALLMGMPELVLANDIKCPKYFDVSPELAFCQGKRCLVGHHNMHTIPALGAGCHPAPGVGVGLASKGAAKGQPQASEA